MMQIIFTAVEHGSRKILRASAYFRVSKLIEEQEYSFETQKRAYEEMNANDPNLTLVKVYDDVIAIIGTSQNPM